MVRAPFLDCARRVWVARGAQPQKGSLSTTAERTESPLGMYEAINLQRQIASSLVRSQANCWDAVEYRSSSARDVRQDVRSPLSSPRRPSMSVQSINRLSALRPRGTAFLRTCVASVSDDVPPRGLFCHFAHQPAISSSGLGTSASCTSSMDSHLAPSSASGGIRRSARQPFLEASWLPLRET